jgi:hypothetical protein
MISVLNVPQGDDECPYPYDIRDHLCACPAAHKACDFDRNNRKKSLKFAVEFVSVPDFIIKGQNPLFGKSNEQRREK